MNFVVEMASKCSGRTGTLAGVQKLAHVEIQTPGFVYHTKGGSIPHLSKEVENYLNVEPKFLQYSLTNTEHMEEAVAASGAGIANFTAQKQSVALLVLQDPAELCLPNFHEKDLVPIYSRSGRKNYTSEKYFKLVETFKPNIYVPLFDGDTTNESSKKRVQKSFDRTETFVEQCLELHRKSDTLTQSTLLGPIIGGFNTNIREKSVKFLKKFDADFGGYLIAGLHSNGGSATELDKESLLDIVSQVCKELPNQKPRFLFGAYTPKMVLELVVRGIDVFDTSYPYLKTKQNRALTFSFSVDEPSVENMETELDVKDTRWADDFTGFSSSCSCLACTKHTRAYSHHLYNTREMLGPILLMIHNLHHYNKFFQAIRKHVSNDTISTLIEHLEKQKDVPQVVEEQHKISMQDINAESPLIAETAQKRVKV
ncbi:queuine tRNA-ribosyltransferase accessory subunit 2 [Uranotaenia lowii]|uniref:queuine tRNA-ribosyltransferase accessory subunit 2 n=1 Tax=Uranotaenia lowii TaxID=190385 RepID=UPI002479519F|nr:queuine tRNA-ribosyltransferase accessory subunit 2 [Uranotaenia lowii]